MKPYLLLAITGLTFAQEAKPPIAIVSAISITDKRYSIYRGDGTPSTLDQVVAESQAADVTFLGELHDDPVAHYLEEQILRRTWVPGLALSLEMFERDTQYIMDEYLAGYITQEHLISSGRAWKNYKQDYRPLVEFVKEKHSPVIAANAPRRYVNRVSRLGAASLAVLEPEAKRMLPPLPYAAASPEYAAKFARIMKENRGGQKAPTPEAEARSLEAQSLWDAGMAFSIADFITTHPGARVLHVNGSFHTAQRLGTVEHLARYRPGASVLVVTMISDSGFPAFDVKTMQGQGDFVIVTDSKVPRSYADAPSEANKD